MTRHRLTTTTEATCPACGTCGEFPIGEKILVAHIIGFKRKCECGEEFITGSFGEFVDEPEIADLEVLEDFTPGRWSVGKIDGAVLSTVVSTSPKNTHELDGDYYGGCLVAESIFKQNAKLISRAPALFEFALQFVKEWRATCVEPEEVDNDWAELYERAKELVKP